MTDRIASITPYLVPADPVPHPWWSHKAYILVRIETSDGIVGWGECHNLSCGEETQIATLQSIAPILVGKPAGDIRLLMSRELNNFARQRPRLEVHSAFAGLEIALWDILGKRLASPVYQLMGGACHEFVPVYSNIYSPNPQTPERFAEMAASQVAAGHQIIKLYPFTADTPVAEGIAVLAAVREAVGPDIGLAVDLWRQADPQRTLELASAMEPFELLWIEDPFAPTDAASLRDIRDKIRQPLLTGETLPGRREFEGLFAQRAVDMVNPDICLSGILELQAIAAMAEIAQVTVSPHNSNTMALGTAAAVHASLGIPNLGPIECFPLFETAMDHLCSGRLNVDEGYIGIPGAHGIGIEFDEQAMLQYRC